MNISGSGRALKWKSFEKKLFYFDNDDYADYYYFSNDFLVKSFFFYWNFKIIFTQGNEQLPDYTWW